jgi:two-component system, chemotaxis family, response regulator Rcp1
MLKPRILIVEDNPGDVELLRMAFNRAQLECDLTIIADGREALIYVRDPDAAVPDLAVLDLNVPKNDGLEILEAMRGADRYTPVPVIVLTSSSSPGDAARVQALGVTCHLIKPLELEQFMDIGRIVKQVLEGDAEAPPRNASTA